MQYKILGQKTANHKLHKAQDLPPYVDILVTHTRLSTYGRVMNHPTASADVRRYFRTAGLSASLGVMRAAIQGESQLKSMPNNTAIMISFAACFALSLSAYTSDASAVAPGVRKLIDETADVLERIGTVTAHRNGLSLLYGRYLRHLVRATRTEDRPANMATSQPSRVEVLPELSSSTQTTQQGIFEPQVGNSIVWSDALQFSSMSNDQILQVLNHPGNNVESSIGGLSLNDTNSVDWLQWPEFFSV
jgi:hypothetical protein